MKSYFKNAKSRIILSVLLIVVVICSFFGFEHYISNLVSETSTNVLTETALLYAGTFKVKLQDQLHMLESQARYFEEIDMNDYNTVKKTIISTKGVGEFKKIAVANTSGMTINYDGKTSGNISRYEYFKKALDGDGSFQISPIITKDEDGDDVFTLAVPIIQNKKPVGLITGTISYEKLDELFAVETFQGNGYSFVITQDGDVIIGSKSKNRLLDKNNIIDFFKETLPSSDLKVFVQDMNGNKTNILTYSHNDQTRICVYTPIHMNNWYVLTVVSEDYIFTQQRQITRITILIITITMLVFTFLLLIITGLLAKTEKVEKDNERYTIANSQTQSLIFEYDFQSQLIEFTGNTDFLLGENVKTITVKDFSRIEFVLHESEKNLLQRIENFFISSDTSYSSEFRILDKNGDYCWYRLNGTKLMDQKKRYPLKFIGNMINVNEQVAHEQELKALAETDQLSGLYNKVTMEKKITSYISTYKTKSSVFFIVDLDNFKAVNDKLGHGFGDAAISDTATKLTLVFSEKDFIGRIGGDEFAVFMCLNEGIDKEKALKIINDKARTLCTILTEDYTNGEESVRITSSIGISIFPEMADDFKGIFKRADSALYSVKQSGKNNYAIYDESMGEEGESVYE